MVVTAEEFHKHVACKAYLLWKEREPGRRRRDWEEAKGLLATRYLSTGAIKQYDFCRPDGAVIGQLITVETIRPVAETVHASYKDGDAHQDWFEALVFEAQRLTSVTPHDQLPKLSAVHPIFAERMETLHRYEPTC